MKALVLFVLYAGLFEFILAKDRLQSFSYRTSRYLQKAAQENCSSDGQSLITLFDREHLDIVSNGFIKEPLCSIGFWVGLKKKTKQGSTWSDGTEVTFNESSVKADKYQQTCEALDKGQWKGFNCSERKLFMCETSNGYLLIKRHMDWCQALQFCKKNYHGLARINSTEENEQANYTSEGKTVWIGLMHDQWEWPNQKCSLFRELDTDDQPGNCVFLKFQKNEPKVLKPERCDNEKCALCSKGKVRIQVIQQNSSWDEALTYCETMHSRLLWIEDESDQKAVSMWLQQSTFDANAPLSLWIGLRQSVLFGFWIWRDRMVNWSNWKDGNIPEKSPSNHCGVIDRDDFTWRNEDCNRKLPFLCEEDIADLYN